MGLLPLKPQVAPETGEGLGFFHFHALSARASPSASFLLCGFCCFAVVRIPGGGQVTLTDSRGHMGSASTDRKVQLRAALSLITRPRSRTMVRSA